jgi:hypothetical protein
MVSLPVPEKRWSALSLDCPDARFLAILMPKKVVITCSWHEVYWGTFPFAAWAALAAREFFVGQVSPQLTTFLAWLDRHSMVSASGSPAVQEVYLALRKFMATTSALDIEYNVRDVFIPVLGQLEEVGPHHSSTWDPLFLKLLLLRHTMAHEVDVPMSALEEVAAGLGEVAAAEGLMQSLRTSATPSPRKAISALAIRAEEEDGPHGELDSYLVEEGDTYEVFEVGATGWGAIGL